MMMAVVSSVSMLLWTLHLHHLVIVLLILDVFPHVLSAVQVPHSVYLLTRVPILPLLHWRYSFLLAE